MNCQHDIISLGAGVQSSTMLLMALKGETDFMPQSAIFCDTKDEPKKVYQHLKFLKKEVGHKIKIITISKGRLSHDALYKKNRFASLPLFVMNKEGKLSMIRRQCTNEYKITPFQSHVFNKIIDQNWRKNKIRKWLGISVDETIRMGLSHTKYIQNYYPLVEKRMNRIDCINWNIKNGYPIPPKSSCIYCPFHSDEHWLDMKTHEPEEFEMACKFDENIRWALTRFTLKSPAYLHRSLQPLRDVDFTKGYQSNLFSNLETCGVCLN